MERICIKIVDRCNFMKNIFTCMSKGFSLKKDLKKEFHCVCCMEKESSYISTAILNSYIVKNHTNVLTCSANLDHLMDSDLFIHAVLKIKMFITHYSSNVNTYKLGNLMNTIDIDSLKNNFSIFVKKILARFI